MKISVLFAFADFRNSARKFLRLKIDAIIKGIATLVNDFN